jgi:hypothetical protein
MFNEEPISNRQDILKELDRILALLELEYDITPMDFKFAPAIIADPLSYDGYITIRVNGKRLIPKMFQEKE